MRPHRGRSSLSRTPVLSPPVVPPHVARENRQQHIQCMHDRRAHIVSFYMPDVTLSTAPATGCLMQTTQQLSYLAYLSLLHLQAAFLTSPQRPIPAVHVFTSTINKRVQTFHVGTRVFRAAR